MSNNNNKEMNSDEYYTVEYILCERPTLAPGRKKGKIQYLVKYEKYEFDECYWIHACSIKPHAPNTPFHDWNLLNKSEKNKRFDFLNKPKEFMCVSPREKIELGWKYVFRFDLLILTQTPTPPPSVSVSTNSKSNPYSWKPKTRI